MSSVLGQNNKYSQLLLVVPQTRLRMIGNWVFSVTEPRCCSSHPFTQALGVQILSEDSFIYYGLQFRLR